MHSNSFFRSLSKGHLVLLIVILSLGAWLRFSGLSWGMPLLLHPDEWAISRIAARMDTDHTWNPDYYDRPNHVSIYLSSLAYPPLSRIVYGQSVASAFPGHQAFFYLVSRSIAAILGTLLILAFYFFARSFDPNAALPAALIAALFEPFVRHAHFATPEVSLVFLLTCILIVAIRYLRLRSKAALVIAGVLCAAAVAEKYPGGASVLTLLVCIFAANRRQAGRIFVDVRMFLGVFIVSLFIISPWLFLHPDRVIESLLRVSDPEVIRVRGVTWFANILFYASAWIDASGVLLTLASCYGLVVVWQRHRNIAISLIVSPLLWFTLSFVGFHAERYALPMYIAPLLLASVGCADLLRRVRSDKRSSVRLGIAAFLVLLLISMAIQSVYSSRKFTLSTTIADADMYAKKHGISRTNTSYEGYTPLRLGGGVSFLDLDHPPKKMLYLMLSSQIDDRYLAEPSIYVRENVWYARVMHLPLVAQFSTGCPLPKQAASFASFFYRTEPGSLYLLLRSPSSCRQGPTITIRKLAND